MTPRERVIAAFSTALEALEVQIDAESADEQEESAYVDAYYVLVQVWHATLDKEEGYTDKALARMTAKADAVRAEQQVETGE